MTIEEGRKQMLYRGKLMTQSQFAKRAGVSHSTINNIESGRYKAIGHEVKLVTKKKIAKALGITVEHLEV